MLVDRKNLSLHLPWIILALLGTIGAVAWYWTASRRAAELLGGSSLPGFSLGVAGGLIILFEFLLWPRKHFRTWRIGRAQVWMRAHIWLGLLCVPLAILHSGFQLGGTLTIILSVLFALVIASGLIGLALQQWLPRMMFDQVPAETIYSQIDHIAEQYSNGAEELVLAACGISADEAEDGERGPRRRLSEIDPAEPFVTVGALRTVGSVQGKVLQTQVPTAPLAEPEPLRAAFFEQIDPFLREGARSGSVLANSAAAGDYFRKLRTRLEPAAEGVVETLENLCAQRRQFILQARLHAWLHGWLWVHLPLSVVLVLVLGLHIFAALKFW